jgi:hypothetical protein
MKLAYSCTAIILAVLIFSSPARAADAAAPRFSRDILPILSENCFQCHGPDEKSRKAKLRLDTQEGALHVITPKNSDDSKLYLRITSDADHGIMPPVKSGKKLTEAQKELLRRWIDAGAAWGKHWAYETPQHADLPAVKNSAWVRNGIDAFVLARLEQDGLTPAPEASKETLIRRVTLDLTGLPPTLSEIDDFLKDTSTNAYEKVVDRLLQSPRYGERMATDWLDEARYADTNGFQNDFARTMWPWRDWLIESFNRNQPFDQFVIEQLAGDLLANPTREQRIATGFNRNNRTVTEAGSIDEEYRVENAVDRVETTATVFLGLTMGCARCHDHKFDPLSQREFYQFYAFFNSVNEKGVYTETRGNVPPLVSLATQGDEEKLKQLNAAIKDAERELAAQFTWDNVFHETATRKLRNARAKVEKQRKAKTDFENSIPTVMVMEDLKTPRETFVLARGRYDMPDKNQKVAPGVPAILPPLPAEAPRNRLGLAQWLVDPANPLTARVTVNRFWQHYFGVGLVKTAENFGVQGELPPHLDLIDWLATEFIRTGWNVKAMQRLIVTSATYRQASNANTKQFQHDPDNRLLGRGPRLRLPAEVVRDNALAVSGLLVEKIGGPSIKPYQPERLWEELAGGAGEGPYVQEKGANLYRRSLYIYRKRTVPHPAMTTFDAPSREVCQVKRSRTNTPLQALELLNDVTYVEAARQLGRLMLTDGGRTPEERVTFAFRRATARKPSEAELRILLRGLERYRQTFAADKDAAQKFLRHGDSPADKEFNAAELAAYMATASVILNLDETITKE